MGFDELRSDSGPGLGPIFLLTLMCSGAVLLPQVSDLCINMLNSRVDLK